MSEQKIIYKIIKNNISFNLLVFTTFPTLKYYSKYTFFIYNNILHLFINDINNSLMTKFIINIFFDLCDEYNITHFFISSDLTIDKLKKYLFLGFKQIKKINNFYILEIIL